MGTWNSIILSGRKREKYILGKIKELAEQWNRLPQQGYDKDKILFLIEKRAKYLGVEQKIIWSTSPGDIWLSLMSSIRASIKLSPWGPLNPLLTSSTGPPNLMSLYATEVRTVESLVKLSLERLRWASLGSALRSSLGLFVEKKLESPLWSFFEDRLDSLWPSLWSFCEFVYWDICYFFNEDNTIKNYVMCLPEAYKSGLGFAVITDKAFYALPLPEYYLNQQNKLHRDPGPAVIWPDGTKEYYLNGVMVPRKVAETSADELDPNIILTERNAEIRREIVRKIGIERVCHLLNTKTIDRKGDYELLLLDTQVGRGKTYLKMKNPSLGIYHIEGVPPEIGTVTEALNWRNQADEEPEILT